MPIFFLQISDHKGEVVKFEAGGSLEVDLRKAICDKLIKKLNPLSFRKTIGKKLPDVINEVFMELKQKTITII